VPAVAGGLSAWRVAASKLTQPFSIVDAVELGAHGDVDDAFEGEFDHHRNPQPLSLIGHRQGPSPFPVAPMRQANLGSLSLEPFMRKTLTTLDALNIAVRAAASRITHAIGGSAPPAAG
jgi:hypothetical protein